MFSKRMLKHVVFSGLLEFGPVLLFLFSFGHMTIYGSTMLLMIGTIISTIATYHLQKRIPYLALYVAAITLFFGYMTFHFHKVKFIQMRDTLYDVTCALTLITGIMINVPFLKLAFNEVIPMTDRAWHKLTHYWVAYFILIAVSNEIVRRYFTLHDWFEFKGWIVASTALFGLVSLYVSYEEKEGEVR
jgi:intracellular septation protein